MSLFAPSSIPVLSRAMDKLDLSLDDTESGYGEPHGENLDGHFHLNGSTDSGDHAPTPKEPFHSILKHRSSAEETEKDKEDHLVYHGHLTEPIPIPATKSALALSSAHGGPDAVVSSFGTSPGQGSLHDMWRLWTDDGEGGSEFPIVVPPVRRSLSLKAAYKMPAGTPSPKKMVRFADAMGLDLEKVRHFLQDQLPTTPVALDDAPIASIPNEKDRFAKAKYITAMFPQPCLATSFLDRIRSQKVSLDSVQTTDFVVTGIVRVLNIAFKKSVYVRYTFDKWKTTLDTLAQYIPKSSDGFSDKFQFVLHAPAYFDVGQTMEFAICFKGDDTDYWDNNYGQNYSLWCCAGTEVPGGGYSISPSNSSNAFL